MTHTVDTTNDPVVSGTIYQFKWRCANLERGHSDFSEILSAAVIGKPATPSAPTVDYTQSNSTSLYVQWTLVADGTLPGGKITGYKLYMDDGYGGNFRVIYNTVNISPNINGFLVTG